MRLKLRTEADIKVVLEKFNYFHDGFIKSIQITFLNDFNPDKSRDLLGDIELSINFEHYNYDSGQHPYNRIVSAAFRGVKDIFLDLKVKDPIEWEIIAVNIEPREHMSGQCYFMFSIVYQNFLPTNEAWTSVEKKHDLFLFKEAEFWETDLQAIYQG